MSKGVSSRRGRNLAAYARQIPILEFLSEEFYTKVLGCEYERSLTFICHRLKGLEHDGESVQTWTVGKLIDTFSAEELSRLPQIGPKGLGLFTQMLQKVGLTLRDKPEPFSTLSPVTETVLRRLSKQ